MDIQEADLWQIATATIFHLNSWNLDGERQPSDWADDYLMNASGETFYLYDTPTWHGFDPQSTRTVSGSFVVQDELNWLGFNATFHGSELHTLSLEVDTEWVHVAEKSWDDKRHQPTVVLVDHPDLSIS